MSTLVTLDYRIYFYWYNHKMYYLTIDKKWYAFYFVIVNLRRCLFSLQSLKETLRTECQNYLSFWQHKIKEVQSWFVNLKCKLVYGYLKNDENLERPNNLDAVNGLSNSFKYFAFFRIICTESKLLIKLLQQLTSFFFYIRFKKIQINKRVDPKMGSIKKR
jgi:hypothetical protein